MTQLLRNLRNAAFTFGEGSSQHVRILATVQEHLREMRQKGLKTNLNMARKQESAMEGIEKSAIERANLQPDDLPELMETLASLQLK